MWWRLSLRRLPRTREKQVVTKGFLKFFSNLDGTVWNKIIKRENTNSTTHFYII